MYIGTKSQAILYVIRIPTYVHIFMGKLSYQRCKQLEQQCTKMAWIFQKLQTKFLQMDNLTKPQVLRHPLPSQEIWFDFVHHPDNILQQWPFRK